MDAAPPGATLRLAPGTYAGPITIRRPIHIEAEGRVVIDAGGHGSVVRIQADDVTLRGLHLVHSGANHDTLDSGVQVRGDRNRIEDNRIEDCLFGIELQQADDNRVRGNHISSKALDLGVRGDGIRLWYSRRNHVTENRVEDARDVVVWYSGENEIARNTVERGRYALHFMYSERNLVEENTFDENIVGVFLMYSEGVVVRRNRIHRCVGQTGMGIGFKESSDVTVEGNEIYDCAKGIYLDVSPYQPDTVNRFLGNRIGYNGVGVLFHNDWFGNRFHANEFVGNFAQVAVQGGGSATRNEWSGNFWDDYQGFDRNGDGTGDTPYDSYAFADRLWMEFPEAAFFRGSPVLEALDFLERLAPFSAPIHVLRDPQPRIRLPRTADR